MVTQIEEETGTLPPNLPRGVPPETAAANADVQAIIAPRLTMLMEIANSFLLTIIESMDTVPYGIRWICKQIRSLTRVSTFQGTTHTACEETNALNSANIPMPPTMRSAHSLVVSSSCASLIRPWLPLKRTCWSMVLLPSIRAAL
jgi:GTPase-activator protein for Ras-like GTPase